MTPPMVSRSLDRRRRELSMSYRTLARRSGVSMPTVVRILSGRHAAPALNNVAAIAEALGMKLQLAQQATAAAFRADQAKRKAAILVEMLQGTSGLEGQGLDKKTVQRLRRDTVRDLMSGSPRKLW